MDHEWREVPAPPNCRRRFILEDRNRALLSAFLRETDDGEWVFTLHAKHRYFPLAAETEEEAKAAGLAIWRTQ